MKNIKKNLLSLFLFFFVSLLAFGQPQEIIEISPLDNMPIIKQTWGGILSTNTPIANRGEEYRRFLSASVKIQVKTLASEGTGSGTIVGYDASKGIAYVGTCGHLWGLNQEVKIGEKPSRSFTTNIIVWYKNEEKLKTPISYPATILFYSSKDGADVGLISFKPDWIPNYFAIAEADYPLKEEMQLNSCGCDSGSEVALYKVNYLGIKQFQTERGTCTELVTKNNSPRPGRSGGGLITDDGLYVGICVKTSNKDGSGIGFFTPLSVVHEYYKKNGFEWLLSNRTKAKELPIVNHNNKNEQYDKDYILIPGG